MTIFLIQSVSLKLSMKSKITKSLSKLNPKSIFNFWDLNDDGLINVRELQHALHTQRIYLTYEQAKEKLEENDSNFDGKLNYEEFKQLLDIR